MILRIYSIIGCKKCTNLQPYHNNLSDILRQSGIEVEGVTIGEVNGIRYYPYDEDADLCRKKDNPMSYVSPVYILRTKKAVVKLKDLTEFKSVESYADYVIDIAEQVLEQQ